MSGYDYRSKFVLFNLLVVMLFCFSDAEDTLLCSLSLNNKNCYIYYQKKNGYNTVYGLTASGDSIKPYGWDDGYNLYNVLCAFTLPNKKEFALFMDETFCQSGGICGGRTTYNGIVYLGSIKNDSIQLKFVQGFSKGFNHVRITNVIQNMDSSFYLCGLQQVNSRTPPNGYFVAALNPDLSKQKEGILPCTSSSDCSKYQCTAQLINSVKVLHYNRDTRNKNLVDIVQLSNGIHISANSPIQKLSLYNLLGSLVVVKNIQTSGNGLNIDINLTDTGIKKGLYCFQIVFNDLSVANEYMILR